MNMILFKKIAFMGVACLLMVPCLRAAEHDLDEVAALLKGQEMEAWSPERVKAANLLVDAFQDVGLSGQQLLQVVDIIIEYHLEEMIPALIVHVDRMPTTITLFKSEYREYPCVKALIKLGRKSAGPLLEAIVKEEDPTLSSLYIYCFMAVSGEAPAREAVAARRSEAKDEKARTRIDSVLREMTRRAAVVPYHLAPE